ncbi:hypothetical protein GOP47_0007956 [Adiantum capillus-veneris]|uniref:OVATE domain-containing protein n=1 Tax=Adiantum capillus-veneris TaxID=13818 RepID=A0A9D4V383_ADICA|nr:hypothetical protein GOP47_0007956 [Adiantum capillus-veneris]
MRFKLLHVRPHIWLFKQQETLATKASIDDSSGADGPVVYKRSTSLKLVKSDPSAANSHKGAGELSPSDEKPATIGATISSKRSQKQGKNVQVCTVVDAGCTCRATVTSQHKQKTAPGSSNVSSRDVGSLHDVCRPRRSQFVETKGAKHVDAVASNLHSKSSSYSSRSPGTNGSMVSRLVCKSSHDVIKHTQLEQSNVICKALHDEDAQLNAITGQVRDTETNTPMQMDVHEIECKLRNAGLEERRRSSKKKNKLSYEEDSLTSSELSSSLSTSCANTDTVLTTTTSEMQDMLVNSNPAFDMDVPTPGSHVMSLDDLRASIAQRKLANLSPQASLSTENVGLADGLRENSAFTASPSSFSSENVRSSHAVSPQSMQRPNRRTHKEKVEVSVKHVVDVNKRRSVTESDDISHQRQIKQSQRASSNTPSKVNGTPREDKTTSRRPARKIGMAVRKEMDVENAKFRDSRCLTLRERYGVNRNAHAQYEANSKEADIESLALERRDIGYLQSDTGQDKQVVSSSCEIQVLSHDDQSDGGHRYPMLRIHVGGTSSSSDGVDVGASTLEEGALGHEIVTSESAVAMVKSSYDPRRDFKESMLEMVAAKQLRAPRQLQQLLQCYLSLNPQHYHPTIIKVFHELCSELFQ